MNTISLAMFNHQFGWGTGFPSKATANRFARDLGKAGFCVSMSRTRSVIRLSGWMYTVWIEEN